MGKYILFEERLMTKFKSLVIILMILIMSGCAGKNFTFTDASTVEVGDTRAMIVKKMKGEPYHRTAKTVDGKVIETYIWTFANGLTGSTKSVPFILTDGIVTATPTITKYMKDSDGTIK